MGRQAVARARETPRACWAVRSTAAMTARLAPTRNASACMGCGYWRGGTPAPLRGATGTSTLAPGRGATRGGGRAVRGAGGGWGAARHVAPGAAAVAAAVGSGALAAFAQAAAFSAARHGACAGPGGPVAI